MLGGSCSFYFIFPEMTVAVSPTGLIQFEVCILHCFRNVFTRFKECNRGSCWHKTGRACKTVGKVEARTKTKSTHSKCTVSFGAFKMQNKTNKITITFFYKMRLEKVLTLNFICSEMVHMVLDKGVRSKEAL